MRRYQILTKEVLCVYDIEENVVDFEKYQTLISVGRICRQLQLMGSSFINDIFAGLYNFSISAFRSHFQSCLRLHPVTVHAVFYVF